MGCSAIHARPRPLAQWYSLLCFSSRLNCSSRLSAVMAYFARSSKSSLCRDRGLIERFVRQWGGCAGACRRGCLAVRGFLGASRERDRAEPYEHEVLGIYRLAP